MLFDLVFLFYEIYFLVNLYMCKIVFVEDLFNIEIFYYNER